MLNVKEIPLTQGKVAIVDAADYEWLAQWKWFAHEKNGMWYAHRNHLLPSGKRGITIMHRQIVDAPPGVRVDHENTDGLDNRRANLRLATHQQNQCNRGAQRNNTSGYKGVSWNKGAGKWRAQIVVHGRKVHLGYFLELKAAAEAYRQGALNVHGEFARAS